jgi:Ca2+-transporting ATPase
MLIVFAGLQLFVSFYSSDKWAWLQAISVAFAVVFACLIGSLCDYAKQKQQLRQVAMIQDETCKVIRGAAGTSQDKLVKDIVVGDLVTLEAGDRVPADCICLDEMDMHVDQSMYYPF